MQVDSTATIAPAVGRRLSILLRWAVLGVAAVLFALHFLHLNADFPNQSPWMDWAKYTDEGWYGDAAIRHYVTGHWYWKGDFNPAVALPMWPALELIVFRFTGVSAAAARALTLCVFGLTLATCWLLLDRFTRPRAAGSALPLAAPLAVLMLCASPFLYVFERMAILEPLLIALTLLALLTASHLHAPHLHAMGDRRALRWRWLPAITLGLLLPAMVLTKTTAIVLLPAIAYMVWARAGYRLRTALSMAALPAIMALAIWAAYYGLFVRPHYLADYRYLFSANGYTGMELEPFERVVFNTVNDGFWMGHVLYVLLFAMPLLVLFWRPRLLRNPLLPSLLLWIGGYFVFLAYHNNLQPRYYLVLAVPATLVVALGLDAFREMATRRTSLAASIVAALAVLAIVIPDVIQQVDFIANPTYTFREAADGIAQTVRADKGHSDLVLSISGSDLTLMTGLPSIDDDFGTLELVDRVRQYRPGWYAAWNELDDDKMEALAPFYNIVRVASFVSMDDPDRNLLILYRLDRLDTPTALPPPAHKRARPPRPLLTKLGQQPTTQQLQH